MFAQLAAMEAFSNKHDEEGEFLHEWGPGSNGVVGGTDNHLSTTASLDRFWIDKCCSLNK